MGHALDQLALLSHCFVVGTRTASDPVAAGLLADAHALGIDRLTNLQCFSLYFVHGPVDAPALDRLAAELLGDPVAQTSARRSLQRDGVALLNRPDDPRVVETARRPGVTDPVAEHIVRSARLLGIEGVERAATGRRYELYGPLTDADVQALATRLLSNPVIEHYALGEIEPSWPQPEAASGQVDIIALRALGPEQLLAVSAERRAALDLAEMRAVQAYFLAVGRDPTDVEFETLAQTWSEHCVHKTFKAHIELDRRDPDAARHGVVDGLLKTFIRSATEAIGAPWVRSAFVDNAGIVEFDDEYELSFKVETHNHPSAIEPFGGANTGVGGVIRDVLGVSARPIATTDVLCFGPPSAGTPYGESLPAGVLPPRRVRSGVVAGVADYGNKIGLPTVNGAVWYDLGYSANPLVFCGCLGLAPKDRHPRSPSAMDRLVVLGGRTGRDGLRGATFSSMTMDALTGEVAGASVQIGDPITEKGLIEVIARARDLQLYSAITDCGAGGLSSAVGEMASTTGAEVELQHVRLKYQGLAPWEIWLSEAQERMVLAVPAANVPALQALCDTFDVELTDIGRITGDGQLVVRYQGRVVLDLDNAFLHEGLPQRVLCAEQRLPARQDVLLEPELEDYGPALLALLAHPNLASKAAVVRVYDHEVQGGTVVKPLTGAEDDGPSDACVLKPAGTSGMRGVVLANGLNPEYGKLDPYRMAVSVVDEAIRNAAAVGADPERIALLDNFCWGDPQRPETLGGLVAAARGCHQAALHYRAPFISGKDSLNNEYTGPDGQRQAIPPTLLISAVGLIEDVGHAVTMDLKAAGNALYLLGDSTPVLGGSHWRLLHPPKGAGTGEEVPGLSLSAPRLYRALHAAMRRGLVRACHDLSEGGLAVAAAEMCIGGRLGLELEPAPGPALPALFGEANGRLLVEVRPEHAAEFEAALDGLPLFRLGRVTSDPLLVVRQEGRLLLSLPVERLVAAWATPS